MINSEALPKLEALDDLEPHVLANIIRAEDLVDLPL